jgi:hypothetical protein
MSDMKSQLQKTGHSASNAKDGETNSVLRPKEISHLIATFARRVLSGHALRRLRSKGT